VLDRSGDGLITHGGELFGVDTLLPDGSHACVGFDALAALDTNYDGRVDANDGPQTGWLIARDLDGGGSIGSDEHRGAGFGDLRVWRDLDSDGQVDNGELRTLAQSGIASIGSAAIPVSGAAAVLNSPINENTGNRILARGSFTRSDGSTGGAYALNLLEQNFHRRYTDPIVVPDTLAGLPDIAGSGRLRDLRQAAVGSSALRDAVAAFSAGSSRAAQCAVLDNLLNAWGDTSDMDSSREAARRIRVHPEGWTQGQNAGSGAQAIPLVILPERRKSYSLRRSLRAA